MHRWHNICILKTGEDLLRCVGRFGLHGRQMYITKWRWGNGGDKRGEGREDKFIDKIFVPIIWIDLTYFPKSSGSDVRDISFNPNIVRFFSCEKPSGNLSMGFELKSTVCRLCRNLISSGISGISVGRNIQKRSFN